MVSTVTSPPADTSKFVASNVEVPIPPAVSAMLTFTVTAAVSEPEPVITIPFDVVPFASVCPPVPSTTVAT